MIRQTFHQLSALKQKMLRDIDRVRTPITPADLRRALDGIMGGMADTLMVHSSLSSCGQYTAGAADVVAALIERANTLVLPTHSYCYPQADELGPVYDARHTPSAVGLLTNLFRKHSGVVRSIQATHSLAAAGPRAERLCVGHYLTDTPCGVGTPYARLLDWKASALMLGVTFHYYTLFHTAEDLSGSDHAYQAGRVDSLRVVDDNGTVCITPTRRQNRAPYRFEEAGWLLAREGLVRRIALGRGELYFVPDCGAANDFIVERLRSSPDFLRTTCALPMR